MGENARENRLLVLQELDGCIKIGRLVRTTKLMEEYGRDEI